MSLIRHRFRQPILHAPHVVQFKVCPFTACLFEWR